MMIQVNIIFVINIDVESKHFFFEYEFHFYELKTLLICVGFTKMLGSRKSRDP